MSFSKRPGYDVVCYTKPLDFLKKGWNEHFFWVDAFACPASFSLHTGKSVSKDPFPKSTEFNAEHYASLVAYPAPFHKYPEPFLMWKSAAIIRWNENTYLMFLYENRRNQEKRKSVIVDSDEPSHPAKKLRKDHRIPVGTSIAGKSMPAIQQLLVGAVQNAAVRGEPVPSFPFVTSSVSTKRRFVISLNSSHHSGTHIAETEADSLIRSSTPAMTTATTVTVTVEPIPCGFSDLTGNDFLVGDIRTVIDLDSDLQKVYVPRWNVTNGSRLDDNQDCREMVDEFAPLKFFASVCGIEHDQLFAEFNMGAARHMTLSAEVRIRAEYNIKEKRRLKSVVDDQAEVLKKKGDLDVRVVDLQLRVKAREARGCLFWTLWFTNCSLARDILCRTSEKVAVYENCMSQLEKFQDERMKEVIDKAIKKGMQDGLAAGIPMARKVGSLSDVAAFNPSAESDYISTLQEASD
ncbi:hypothetical protein Tco_0727093 [Tanacetum coccineum]|uniref:Transposase (Putative), gypsy type n=1 Tax=Tanacetum coccineum TaxID=301880 RepID=A0ABQ4YJU9_9ASTR